MGTTILKYGLLVFKESVNIGDDIQSYAAQRFLPTIDYYIDRESLNTFKADKNESVAVIMNAWYMYHKYNWPPSPYINPCFLSIHISDIDFYMIGEDFLEDNGYSYLKKYGEIGCRDTSTKEMLQRKGISAYFSGCLTLTIEPKNNLKRGETICCVDLDSEVLAKIKDTVPSNNLLELTHQKKQDIHFDWNKRKKCVEELLECYQKAKCVITTRLHCALPCLALGTPVLLIYKDEDYYKNRMEDYLPFLYYCSKSEFLEGFSYNISSPPPNKEGFKKLRSALISQVTNFIDSTKSNEENVVVKKDYWFHALKWQSSLLKRQLSKLQNLYHTAWLSNQLTDKTSRQKEEIENLYQKLNQLEKWYKNREEWYEKKIAEYDSQVKQLNEKREDIKKWYDNREQWYKRKITEYDLQIESLNEKQSKINEWYENREKWYTKHCQQLKQAYTLLEDKAQNLEKINSQSSIEIERYKQLLETRPFKLAAIALKLYKRNI